LFFHTIHAAVFADAGEAWTDRFRTNGVKTSVGGELSLNVIAGDELARAYREAAAKLPQGIAAPYDRHGRRCRLPFALPGMHVDVLRPRTSQSTSEGTP